MILIKSTWEQQPQGPTSVNFSNPLVNCLDNLWLPDALEPVDIISGLKNVGAPSGASLGVGVGGRAIIGTTSGSAVALPASRSSYPCVLVAYGTFTANNSWSFLSFTGSGGSLVLRTDGTGKAQLSLRRNFGTSRTISSTASFPTNTPLCMVAQIFSDTDYRLYVNGEQINGTLSFGTGGTWLTNQYPLAAAHPGSLFVAGQGWGRGTLPDSEALAISANPALLWQMFEPRQIKIPVPLSGGAYSLVANSGSYSYTGQAATLLKSKVLSASSGSYSISGQAATLLKSKLLNASAGSYAYTGQSATISYVSGGVNYTLVASAGAYTYTGSTATLKKSKVLAASSGTYTIAGQNATLAYSGANTVTLKAGSWLRYRIIS